MAKLAEQYRLMSEEEAADADFALKRVKSSENALKRISSRTDAAQILLSTMPSEDTRFYKPTSKAMRVEIVQSAQRLDRVGGEAHAAQGDSCTICTDEMGGEDSVVQWRGCPSAGGHWFHAECIQPWLRTRNTCVPSDATKSDSCLRLLLGHQILSPSQQTPSE